MRYWIESIRKIEKRQPKTYPSLEAAIARMKEANPHLSDEVAKHLTLNDTNWEPDGSLIWKFDNYARLFPPYGHGVAECAEVYGRITCPVLFFWGLGVFYRCRRTIQKSSDPQRAARESPKRGALMHHDQLDLFLRETSAFLTA